MSCAPPQRLVYGSHLAVERWAVRMGRDYLACADGKRALVEVIRARQKLIDAANGEKVKGD